ncbi:MAG: type III-B CRISPR module-associated protein Cmr5 [Chloroflexi bacterium]|nr:type III-B CRISPR module-associated protein Cmr5 [Chloroflexota bacterium]
MSRQRSLEQERASVAWECIQRVQERNKQLEDKKKYAKEYSSLARSAPADIQANGLGQTIAFWLAKGYEWDKKEQQSKPKQDNAHAELLSHVARWLRHRRILPEGKDPVDWISQDATTDEYRLATVEAIAFLTWLKRFAEAELPKEGE